MCVVNKNPLLCQGGVCYVGRGWQDNPDEPSWYLNFTRKPIRGENRFYYIDNNEDHGPDCVADFTKKIAAEEFASDVFSVVVLEFLPTSCFEEGLYTIPNAQRIVKKGGLVMVMSGRDAAESAAQRMRENGLNDVKVVKRVVADVYSDQGMEMARKANAMLTFRLEPGKYKQAYGESMWEDAERLGAEIKNYWIAYSRK